MQWPIVCLEAVPPVQPYLLARRNLPDKYQTQLDFAAIVFEREQYYAALYNPHSPYGEIPPAAHQRIWHPFPATETGKASLFEIYHGVDTTNAQPLDIFGLKSESLNGLRSTLRRRKTQLFGYLTAARFCYELCLYRESLTLADEVTHLDGENRYALAYMHSAAVCLSEKDRERAANLRSIERRSEKLLGERWFTEIGKAREQHEFNLRRHAWRVRSRVEGEAFTRFIKSEKQYCEEERERVIASVDREKVPLELQPFLPLACRYGIGDDPCRAYFVHRIPRQERRRILREVAPQWSSIQRWIDSFDKASLPAEASAFFWLLEAVEEMREGP